VAAGKDLLGALLEAQNDMGEGLLVAEDGRVSHANEAFSSVSGYTMPELVALPALSELFVPEHRQTVVDLMRRHARGEAIADRRETAVLRKSGGRVDVEVVFKSLCGDDGPLRLIVLVRDITVRKRAEEKLQSSVGSLLAVHEAGRLMSSTLEQEEIGARLLKVVLRVSDLEAAVVNLRGTNGRLRALKADPSEGPWRRASKLPEAQAARRKTLETGERRLFRPNARKDPSPMGLCLPLVVRGRLIGLLEAYGYETPEDTTLGLLESVAGQAAIALENARLHGELAERELRLQDLVAELLVAREEERRLVACDIHDELTQVAVAAHQTLQAYADDNPPVSSRSEDKLRRSLELARQTVREARRMIANLRPAVHDDLGLAAGLRMKVDALRAEGWDLEYEETLGEERLPAEVETTLYAVCREALTNVGKHSQTTRASVTLRRLGDRAFLEIRDRGRGFDEALLARNGTGGEHVGLRGMRERVALLGGELRVHSRPGMGTSVVAEVPRAMPIRGVTSSPSRLLIADDHLLAREGLRAVLAGEPDLEVVGEAADGREALELCRLLRPDLLLMDVRMPGMDGLAATRALKADGDATSVLMLTTYEDPDYLFEAVRAGAVGYITKDAGKHELIRAVRGALDGGRPLNQDLAMCLLSRLAREGGRARGDPPLPDKPPQPLTDVLTRRELEILRFLAKGQTNREISRKLVVSPATIKVHVEHILAKLKVSDRTQAAVMASEAGLLDPPR
jgi:PAS domain S-box-containing protein